MMKWNTETLKPANLIYICVCLTDTGMSLRHCIRKKNCHDVHVFDLVSFITEINERQNRSVEVKKENLKDS